MKKMIRKLAALALALVMVLGCAAASATTVDVAFNVDGESAKTVMGGFGMPEQQLGTVEGIAKLLSSLGVKVIALSDGFELDLSLAGTEAVKVGMASVEGGAALVTNLLPNYYLTVKNETVQQLLQQVMQNVPGLGALMGGNAAGMAGVMPENLGAYLQDLSAALTGAMVPGTPAQGTYELEGYTFDTYVPMSIDMPKLKESVKKTLGEMFKDESITSMITTMTGAMGSSAPSADDLKKGAEDFVDHMPDTVTMESYASSTNPGVTYVTGEAYYEGQTAPAFTTKVLSADGDVTIMFTMTETELAITLAISPNHVILQVNAGDNLHLVLDGKVEMGDEQVFTLDVYVNTEAPLATVTVKIGQNGERTLPVEQGEKTELTVEDMMAGKMPETFQTDLYSGIMPLLSNPDIMQLFTLMNPVSTVTVETPVSVDGE